MASTKTRPPPTEVTGKPATPRGDFEAQERQLAERAAKFRATAAEREGVVPTLVDVFSDGVRMQGTVWRPRSAPADKPLPAVLLAHGWGGKRNHLDYSYAPQFCKAGFVALTFDYRGWGESDGVMVAADGKQPKPDVDGFATVKVRIVRKIIDPEWQYRDLESALDFLATYPGVDVSRIAVWGSSFGGGHALRLAANDARIKAVVCQIGAINAHANWINRHPQYRGAVAIRDLAAKHAKGEVMPWNVARPEGLDGMPNLPKVVFSHTPLVMEAVSRLHVPVMILAAEKEETFHNSKNSELVFDMIKERVPAELDYLPGNHYDAYGQPAYGKGVARATQWFQTYIGNPDTAASAAAVIKAVQQPPPAPAAAAAKM